ncbi:hypothetical protein HYW46_03530, partial [Candidatus Daviesbacteria bacterium]|nr:hypothetical protein [Candidatus Daviesbacteria bacterium]
MDDNKTSNNNLASPTNPLANPAPSNNPSDSFSVNSIAAPPSETPPVSLDQNLTPPQPSPWPIPQIPPEPVNPVIPQSNPIPTFTVSGGINQQQLSDNLAAVPQNPSTPSPEPAPTDLSQLTGNNHQPPPDIYIPSVSNNENLIVPNNSAAVPESINTSHHSSVLKILLIGGLFLILTGAASAYFILGLGKSPAPEPTPNPTEQPSAITKPTI